MNNAWLTLLLTASLASGACALEPGDGGPAELGRVAWLRDLDAGFAAARESGKPLFVLFQEVPGCSTCVSFGQDTLSQPLLVEAIETLFVPVCVYTSAGGKDDELRRRYDEPAFNFPVVRYFAPDGAELLPRRDRVWSSGGIATRMVAALAAAGQPAPEWLQLAESGLATERQQTATFAMSCFWEGEAKLGALDGVVAVRPGFVGGQEVVELTFDTARAAYPALLKAATSMECATTVWAQGADQLASAKAAVGERARELTSTVGDAAPDDHLRQLRGDAVAWLPLLPVQAARINAALASEAGIDRWLSPRQRALRGSVEAALARDAQALDGVARPGGAESLPAQSAALQARLDALVTSAPAGS